MATNPVTQNNSFTAPLICCESKKLILIALEVIGGLALSGGAVYLLYGVNVIGALVGAGGGGLLLTGGVIAITAYCLRESRTSPNQPVSHETIKPITEEPIITPVVEKEDEGPVLKGRVYIHTLQSGPIRNDQKFGYNSRIKDEKGNAIEFSPEDIYVEIEGSFSKGDPAILRKDAEGISTSQIYLPSSLFKEASEGSVIHFYFDDQLIELTCCQSEHRSNQRIEEILEYLQNRMRFERSQGLWNCDIPDDQFKDEYYGEIISCKQIDGQSRPWTDFTILKADEDQYGPYKHLLIQVEYLTPQNERIWILNAHKDRIQPSEIVLAETRGFNGQHQLWIVTPHKPELNQFPENANHVEGRSSDGCYFEFTRQLFNPKNGDRLPIYHHGTYCHLNLYEGETYECGFNSSGWLQLKFTKDRKEKSKTQI